ncbi:MAG: hypothetical protein DMF67_06515 [Acidobacteria bacterium]|nr:MAG: hypothetical protein DMF67_06515 [Acidobacteriota bacterium]
MEKSERIRCRVAACREAAADGKEWSFYLINDGDAPLDSAALYRVSFEWGDFGNSYAADVRVNGLAPGAHVLIWRDDGEFRTELSLLVRAGGREVRLSFEFPKLYLQKNLKLVGGVGKRGWEEAAEG